VPAENDGSSKITALLHRLSAGDRAAENELFVLVHAQLLNIAASLLRRERPDPTLQATGLVNEAYLRMAGKCTLDWKDRAHFFSVAASVMRQILVEHARRHRAEKRGAAWRS
jgi:RNA polymerase sigma factor (TIGR02999 family)